MSREIIGFWGYPNPQVIEEWQKAGAVFQSNIGSLFGRYGKEAKSTLITLLKHEAISFIASDIHHSRDTFYEDIPKLKKKCLKFCRNRNS